MSQLSELHPSPSSSNIHTYLCHRSHPRPNTGGTVPPSTSRNIGRTTLLRQPFAFDNSLRKMSELIEQKLYGCPNTPNNYRRWAYELSLKLDSENLLDFVLGAEIPFEEIDPMEFQNAWIKETSVSYMLRWKMLQEQKRRLGAAVWMIYSALDGVNKARFADVKYRSEPKVLWDDIKEFYQGPTTV